VVPMSIVFLASFFFPSSYLPIFPASLFEMSIFIKIDISKPSLIQYFKKKISIIINFEQKFGNYAIFKYEENAKLNIGR
jgi:hypothetical protein